VSEIAPIFDLVKDQWSGRKLGRFEVICKLGMGGMSEVFLAWQRGVGGFRRAVVIKRIHDMVKGQDDFVRMFVQEAKITSSLTHSAIAQLHDLSEENGELFMVMEFVPGATLVEIARACLNAQESIPVGLTLAVIRETAMALHYAHTFKDAVGRSRPVIHRDIAEKNIMVSLDGKTKLLDFGIARQQGRTSHTQVGTVKGTAGYMSPEQVKGEKLDGRTDIFSLGIVLHECLTGQRLFKAATRSDEIQALLHGTIPPPYQPGARRDRDEGALARSHPALLDRAGARADLRSPRRRRGVERGAARRLHGPALRQTPQADRRVHRRPQPQRVGRDLFRDAQ
jgi:eukaryotic-like serine/threonine-protein kinase